MRITRIITTALALLALPAMSRAFGFYYCPSVPGGQASCGDGGIAKHIVTDTIRPERIVVSCSLFGVTLLDNLDTYLSNYSHKGLGLNYAHEVFRNARTGNYKWKYQRLFNATAGYAIQRSNLQVTALASQSWSGFHPFEVAKGLTLLAGAQIQLEGGALYSLSNGNNPVAAKLRTALAASGMAIYHFAGRRSEWIARYQVDIPLAGIMFAPEFGQSYYEIFGLGHAKGIIAFTHPGNTPSWRHMLSLDIPIKATTLRIAYVADIYQSRINDINCHIYRNTFSFGFTRTIFKIKRNNRLNAYSPY